MKDIPEIYNRVTAKRPDLCVPAWKRQGEWKMDEETAIAIILARWIEMLPINHHLSHDRSDYDDRETWAVYALDSNGSAFYPSTCRDTPIEALAEHYMS